MFGHITCPCSHLSAEVSFDLSDCFCQERTCTGCRIKDLHTVNEFLLFAMFEVLLYLLFDLHFGGVRQTHREVEFGAQNIIYCAYNKLHYRLRCVIDAALFLGSRVVLEQEIFVEMQHGVGLLCAFAEALHDLLHVGCCKCRNEVIDYPCDAFIKVITGYLLEDFA